MTNRNPKRRSPSGYRAPAATETPAPRRGLLDGLFAPKGSGPATMPGILTSFSRGFALVISTPILLVGVPVVLLLEWLVLLSFGFQGPFTLLGAVFAMAPMGTLADLALGGSVASTGSPIAGLAGVFGFLVLRGALVGLVATVSVERLRTGSVGSWSLRRLARVLPVTIGVNLLSLSVLIVGNVISTLLGPGIGLLIYFVALVGTLYLTAFVAVIAADEDRRLPDTMRRAMRVARIPGAGNLTLAALYAIPSYALLVAPLPGSLVGVNPTALAWAISIVVNLLHVAMGATFTFRYLSVAAEIPDVAPAPRRRR